MAPKVRKRFDLPSDAREIPGLAGYVITSHGTVYSRWNFHGRLDEGWYIVQPRTHQSRPVVGLRTGSRKQYPFQVGALVLRAHVGPRPPGFECRHLDGNPFNNVLSNVCWGTHAENVEDRIRHGRQSRQLGEAHPLSRLSDKKVRAIRELRLMRLPVNWLAKQYEVRRDCIYKVASRRAWKHVV